MTNEYEETDVFGKQIIFNYLVEQIEFNKESISEIGRAYIEETIDYFNDVKEGLEKLCMKRVSHQQHLKEIFEAINGEGREKSIEAVVETIDKLGDAQEQLEQLSESPIDFYETDEASELLDICQKFQNVYNHLD